MNGITGMDYNLATELEAHGYDGEPTVAALFDDISKQGHMRAYSSSRGWLVNITKNGRTYVATTDRYLDVALANLWLKLKKEKSS